MAEATKTPTPPRWLDRLTAPIPKLEHEDRKSLLERIEAGANGGVDFVVMMVLAASLASLGLLQGSTAVVIGAMLVAPLMGPLVGAAMALVQANPRLFRRSMTVTALGLGLCLAVSAGFGALNPGFEPSMEMDARGQADLFDLGIAFASGMVAAYAMGRPNVAGTLAGVAIAAALVPPLAVVGIALTNGRLGLAGNAGILLVTNVVAIILGGALVFRALGVRQQVRESHTPGWVRLSLMLLSLLVILLAAPLFQSMVEGMRAGQRRPLTYAVSSDVTNAVRRYIAGHPGTELIVVGRNSIEPHADITVLLDSPEPLPRKFYDELERVVEDARKEPVRVRIFALRSARERK
jgi:uncharacterized hydrophobic protein (TIGR00271 family)